MSSYLFGVGYTAQDVEQAVARADANLTATATPIHLFCFTYNPNTGRFTASVTEALRLASLLTVAAITVGFFALNRR